MIVIDASTIVSALLFQGDVVAALEALAVGEDGFAAPHLIDLEVAHALRRELHKGRLTEAGAAKALSQLDGLPIQRADHPPLLPLVWALRHNFSTYDAAYVALAQSLDAPLLTRDAKLAKAARTFTQVRLL